MYFNQGPVAFLLLCNQQGCRHDIAEDGTPGYNHGYIDTNKCYRTIMAYSKNWDGCPSRGAILQFSNTMNTYNGMPVGDETTRNNGRKITEGAQTIKNFRPAKISRVSHHVNEC